MYGIATLTAFARNDKKPRVIASGVAAWQSHALNTYSCFSFLMRGIASSLTLLAMTFEFPVIARALVPAAISCMELVCNYHYIVYARICQLFSYLLFMAV